MFSDILRKIMGQNQVIDEAMPESDKEMLAGTLDEILGNLGDAMENISPEQLEELKAKFETDLTDTFASIAPEIADSNAALLSDMRDLLAKWRRRAAQPKQHVPFDVLNDISAERALVESEGHSKKKIDAEMRKMLKQDEKSRTPLMKAIEQGDDAGLLDRIKQRLKAGDDPNARSMLMDTPLAFAYDFDRLDAMSLLLEQGADPDGVGWDAFHVALATGTLEEAQAALPTPHLMRRDEIKRTALELAVVVGQADKVALVLQAMADAGHDLASDPVARQAFAQAAGSGNTDLIQPFSDAGVPPDLPDDFGSNALWEAVNTQNVQAVQQLLAAGADVSGIDELAAYSNNPETTLGPEGTPAVVTISRMLVAAGWRPDMLAEFEENTLRFVTGAVLIPQQELAPEDIAGPSAASTGNANPQEVDFPLWKDLIRTGESAYAARQRLGSNFATPGWCFERFGQSLTLLPDGRWVQIGGEHEDAYMPDFQIFNDVIVHDGQGGVQMFTYPAEVFPPTDFHTATLVDDRILLIGSLGYTGSRPVGETQVLALNLSDFSISAVQTNGTPPGWISRHKAELQGDSIVLSGGHIEDGSNKYPEWKEVWALDLADMGWRKISG